MTSGGRPATALLFFGDLAVFVGALWLMLLVRYSEWPDAQRLSEHLTWFTPLFFLWLIIFYIAGLYGKRVVLFRHGLPGIIFRTLALNFVLAALFFFLLPGVGIAPKTNLVLYFIISLGAIFFWRLIVFPRTSGRVVRERAALIASGPEATELVNEVGGNERYRIEFAVTATPEELMSDFNAFAKKIAAAHTTLLVVDMENDALRPLLPRIYELAFVKHEYALADFYEIYEEVFDRVPLSLLQYDWFLKNVSGSASSFYRILKRVIDIIGGIVMGLVVVVATPFLWLLMKLEGPGSLFIAQTRIGQHGRTVKAYKFRSMRINKAASNEWTIEEKKDNPVTRVGNFLRQTSLDEFPQFINVLRGELSLIGPRNDIEGLGLRLAEAIPYYNIRYIVKPGITGWAQINQQYEQGNVSPQSIEETKTRLAYDFYYIKNRSFVLDLMIALKTIKKMFFRLSAW